MTSFNSLSEVICDETGPLGPNFVNDICNYREKLGYYSTHEGELAAFISYAQAFPNSMLSLVDTYDTLLSGVPNFLCVCLALLDRGYQPVGVRLDSGDLAYLSLEAKKLFAKLADRDDLVPSPEAKEFIRNMKVCASNDINETTLKSLTEQGHGIDIYGIIFRCSATVEMICCRPFHSR